MSSNSELSIYAISKLIDELKNTDVGSLKNDIEKLTNLINTNTTNISTNSDEITDIKNSFNKKSTENTESLEEIKDLIATKFAQKGSSTQPVYVDSTGTIQGTTFGLNSTVPENAKFTDTTYKLNNSVSNDTLKINLNSSASDDNSSVSITGSENISIENSGSTAVLKHIKGDAKNTLATTTTDKKTDGSIAFGGTVKIPTISYDDQGHIVSSSTTDITLPMGRSLNFAVNGTTVGAYPLDEETTLNIKSGSNVMLDSKYTKDTNTVDVVIGSSDTTNTVGTTTKTDGDLYLVGVNDKTGNSAQSYVDGKAKINNGILTVDNIVVNKGITVNSSNVVTEKTYTADNGIKIENNVIKHSNSITAGTASGSSGNISSGGSVSIPKITYDAQGHITAASTTTINLPAVDENGNATATDENVRQQLLTQETNIGKVPILLSKQEVSNKGDYVGAVFRTDDITFDYGTQRLTTPCLVIGDTLSLKSRSNKDSGEYAGGTILFAAGGDIEGHSNGNNLVLNKTKTINGVEEVFKYPLIVSKDMVEMFKTKGSSATITIKNIDDDDSTSKLVIKGISYIKVAPETLSIIHPCFFFKRKTTNTLLDKTLGDMAKYNLELVYDDSQKKAITTEYTNFSFYKESNVSAAFDDGEKNQSFNIRRGKNNQYIYFARNVKKTQGSVEEGNLVETFYRAPKLIMGIDSKDRGKIIYSNNLKIKYRDNSKKDKTIYSDNYAGMYTDEYDTRMAFKSNEIDVMNVPLKGGKATTIVHVDSNNTQTKTIKTNTFWEITPDGQGTFSEIYVKNNNTRTAISDLFGTKTEYLIAVINETNTEGSGTSSKIFRDNADLTLRTTATNNGQRITDFIDSVPAGSTIKFAPGRYEFRDSILITKSINLVGMNHNSMFIKCEPSSNLSNGGTPIFKIGKYYSTTDSDGSTITEGSDDSKISNVSIENIYFDSNEDYQNAPFIKIANVNGFYFRRNRLGVRRINRTSGGSTTTWNSSTKVYPFIKAEQYLANALVVENVWNFSGNITIEDNVTKGAFPLATDGTCTDACVQFDFTCLGNSFSMVYGASWEYLRYYIIENRNMSQLLLYAIRGNDANVKEVATALTYENSNSSFTNVDTTSSSIVTAYPYTLKDITGSIDSSKKNLFGASVDSSKYRAFTDFRSINSYGYHFSFAKRHTYNAIGSVDVAQNNISNKAKAVEGVNVPSGSKVTIAVRIQHRSDCTQTHSDDNEKTIITRLNTDGKTRYIFSDYRFDYEGLIKDEANYIYEDKYTYTTTTDNPLSLEFDFPVASFWDIYFDILINGVSIAEITKEFTYAQSTSDEESDS